MGVLGDRRIVVAFAGDARPIQRASGEAQAAVDDMSEAVEEQSSKVDSAFEAIDNVGSSLGSVFDGLSTAAAGFGIEMPSVLQNAYDMATGFSDLAAGLSGTALPAIRGVAEGFKTGAYQQKFMTAATKAQTAAQTAQNIVMRANPILLVVTAIAALAAAFVIAYKRSETFRNIVHGAMDVVKTAVEALFDVFDKFVGIVKGYAEIITAPYRLAFNAIADLWNNTVGKLEFKVPGWVPGIGGNGFDVPDIPRFANGGLMQGIGIVGERGPELAFAGGQGANVVANGSPLAVEIHATGPTLQDIVQVQIRQAGRRTRNAVLAGSTRTAGA